MSKIIDAVPVAVQRTRRTSKIEINYDAAGAVVNAIAHRWAVVQSAPGVDFTPPVFYGTMVFTPAQMGAGVQTAFLTLAGLVDTADTGP